MSAEPHDAARLDGKDFTGGARGIARMMAATKTARRLWNFAGVGIVAALMGYALYAQLVQGLAACALCMLQRFAMIGLGAVFLVAGLHAPVGKSARGYAALGAVVAAIGVFIAGTHLREQYMPAQGLAVCGPGTLEGFINRYGYFEGLKQVFTPVGECSVINWTFMGLSMPGWVLIWFVALGALAVAANWKPLRA